MFITCDTNFYRNLVENIDYKDLVTLDSVINCLLDAEASKGIKAMMGTISSCEILSHLLDDESTRGFKSCIKASRVLYHHCKENDSSYRLLPSPQTQIAYEYFGFQNQIAIKTQQSVGYIFSELAKDTSSATIIKYKAELEQVKKHISETEKCLIKEIQQYCKSIDPNYIDWNLFVGDKKNRNKFLSNIRSIAFDNTTALAMLLAVYQQIKSQGFHTQYTQVQVERMVKNYVSNYKTSIELRRFFWEQLLNPGFDLTKKSRANFLWDEQILHFVNHKLGNDNIVLITSDQKMVDAAQHCGCKNSIMKYDEYINYLGIKAKLSEIKQLHP